MGRLKTFFFAVIATAVVLGVLVAVDQAAGHIGPARPAGTDFITYHRDVRAAIAAEAERPREPGEYRVYLFGGSTVVGVPYETLLDRLVELFLTEINPDRAIRVVNCAVGAGGLYRASRLMEDALTRAGRPGATGPDALVVYSGHNEYLDFNNHPVLVLEHSPWPWLVGALRRSWTVNRFLSQKGGFFTRANRARSPRGYNRRVARRHARTLARLLDLAKRHDTPLVFCNPASNLADWPPTGERAEDLYLRAQQLSRQGDHERALAYYTMARDHDGMATRAVTAYTEGYLAVPRSPWVEVVDFHHVFIRESGGRAPGENLFLDNCHPNPRGYYLLARGMARGVQRFLDPERLVFHDRYFTPEKYAWAFGFDYLRDLVRLNREEEAFLMANLQFVNGRTRRAVRVLREGLQECPASVRLRTKLASVLWSLPDERDGALELLRDIVTSGEGAAFVDAHLQDRYYFPGLDEAYRSLSDRPPAQAQSAPAGER